MKKIKIRLKIFKIRFRRRYQVLILCSVIILAAVFLSLFTLPCFNFKADAFTTLPNIIIGFIIFVLTYIYTKVAAAPRIVFYLYEQGQETICKKAEQPGTTGYLGIQENNGDIGVQSGTTGYSGTPQNMEVPPGTTGHFGTQENTGDMGIQSGNTGNFRTEVNAAVKSINSVNASGNFSRICCYLKNDHGFPIIVTIWAIITDHGYTYKGIAAEDIYNATNSFVINGGGQFSGSGMSFKKNSKSINPEIEDRLLVKLKVENSFIVAEMFYASYWRKDDKQGYRFVFDIIRQHSECADIIDIEKVKKAFKDAPAESTKQVGDPKYRPT